MKGELKVKYGLLTFTGEKVRAHDGKSLLVWQCDCGNKVTRRRAAVVNTPYRQSCGCLRQKIDWTLGKQLYESGLDYEAIAARLGCHKTTVRDHFTELKSKPVPRQRLFLDEDKEPPAPKKVKLPLDTALVSTLKLTGRMLQKDLINSVAKIERERQNAVIELNRLLSSGKIKRGSNDWVSL